MCIYLDDLSPGRSCGLPGDQQRRASAGIRRCFSPVWPCTGRGLPGRGHCCPRRWSLTPPFHPHTPARAVCFCGPVQKLAPLQALPGFLLCGVRTFLTAWLAARTPDWPEWFHHIQNRIKSQSDGLPARGGDGRKLVPAV